MYLWSHISFNFVDYKINFIKHHLFQVSVVFKSSVVHNNLWRSIRDSHVVRDLQFTWISYIKSHLQILNLLWEVTFRYWNHVYSSKQLIFFMILQSNNEECLFWENLNSFYIQIVGVWIRHGEDMSSILYQCVHPLFESYLNGSLPQVVSPYKTLYVYQLNLLIFCNLVQLWNTPPPSGWPIIL